MNIENKILQQLYNNLQDSNYLSKLLNEINNKSYNKLNKNYLIKLKKNMMTLLENNSILNKNKEM
tara:strand:+ start:3894 stop:4088 length:195 start_codon:yes stop_codon:yes gene_type:complete